MTAAPATQHSSSAAPDWQRLARLALSGAVRREAEADRAYYLRRMHASLAMAEAAADAVAKLVHFDLAGRYSIAARRT